jgi:UDP-N-acetylmuramoyl-L-alanyl-D-glutamate--2,6-diaminopimelate ligase
VGRPDRLSSTGLTTPDPVLLQRSLREFADGGVAACAIEASSIGIAEHRLDGTPSAWPCSPTSRRTTWTTTAAWTPTGRPRRRCSTGRPAGGGRQHRRPARRATGAAPARAGWMWTVSLHQPARLQAQDVRYGAHGLRWTLCEGAQTQVLDTALVGEYNVSNLLGVLAALRALGVPLADAARVCADLPAVPGRMQRIEAGRGLAAPLVVVDYAHTPDALDKALAALRPLAAERGGRLWCVFGCGGDRDPASAR